MAPASRRRSPRNSSLAGIRAGRLTARSFLRRDVASPGERKTLDQSNDRKERDPEQREHNYAGENAGGQLLGGSTAHEIPKSSARRDQLAEHRPDHADGDRDPRPREKMRQ